MVCHRGVGVQYFYSVKVLFVSQYVAEEDDIDGKMAVHPDSRPYNTLRQAGNTEDLRYAQGNL